MTLRQRAWAVLCQVAAMREGKTWVHVAHAYKLAFDITGVPWVMTTDEHHEEILRRFGEEP